MPTLLYYSIFSLWLRIVFSLGWSHSWSQMPTTENPNIWQWARADPNCGFNQMQIPSGSTPLYKIFEEYASNQTKWINDFVPVLEKMLSNGYER